PLLTSDELRGGVGALARAGVLRVAGPIVVDDSAFAGSELNAHWSTDDLDEGYAARTSALSLDGNTVEFHVAPGAVGEPAQISIEPPNDLVRVSGSILTGGPGSGSNLTINRATSAPASALDDPAPNDFRVDGRIETGEVQKYWKPVVGLPNYVGGALARMLAQRGIGFDGSAQTGPAPLAAQPLWIHRSQPLAAIVDEMLTNSNNHSAEQLLRILGAHAGRAGTDANGIAVERRELARLGISREGLRIFDGSGLSPDDRVEALTLAKLVAQELQTPASSALLGAMPRVGLDGTVVYHNLTEALGRARAKSGHIDGVNGLVGTVLSRHHGRIAFAFIVNDPRYQADAITAEEDHALDALADF
ncbi:MAG TPA: D-alanyl-D-alanine carboxypeptidase/D-alanyl-D-alanine-endopeptidase, partial [Candidatus Baltobacteraceae bacterium]|nr:D-alanyl-D-alanine carboxypeptidase/D-alanyl-D-alanine-endopeptidase [Candidatus Baltobacteraceae bacterium]